MIHDTSDPFFEIASERGTAAEFGHLFGAVWQGMEPGQPTTRAGPAGVPLGLAQVTPVTANLASRNETGSEIAVERVKS